MNKSGKAVGRDSRGGLGFYGNTEVQVPPCTGESSRALEGSIHTVRISPLLGTGWGSVCKTCLLAQDWPCNIK